MSIKPFHGSTLSELIEHSTVLDLVIIYVVTMYLSRKSLSSMLYERSGTKDADYLSSTALNVTEESVR